jgi:two-component system response regulator QseB
MPDNPNRAFLVVEKGSPYCKRESFVITGGRFLIGRTWENIQPDLAFVSAYISRNHAEILGENGIFRLTDHSRHGTTINGAVLKRDEPYPLEHGDSIGLAGNEVILSFYLETCPEETLPGLPQGETKIILDEKKREVFLDGKPIELTGNLYTLFHLLYQNRGRVVDNLTIKHAVWPERGQNKGTPLVGEEEVAMLIRRLRQKLGDHAGLICNKRGYGYLLR